MGEAGLKDLHCLIVDDEPLLLLELEEMLRSMGVARVTRAASGTAALDALARVTRPVDCILCDLKMPDGNGLQVLKAIRTGQIKSSRMDACFIMITGVAEQDVIKTAVSLDANGYLVKPVFSEKLRTAIVRARAKHFLVAPERYAAVPVPLTAL